MMGNDNRFLIIAVMSLVLFGCVQCSSSAGNDNIKHSYSYSDR